MLFFLRTWKDLSEIKTELALRDWFYGTKISLSMRASNEPITFIINAEGKDKGLYNEEDFVVVNVACEPVFAGTPAEEACLHAAVYKNTIAGCVLQVQTVDCHLVSEIYGEQKEVTFEQKNVARVFGRDGIESLKIPIVEHEQAFLTLLEEQPQSDRGAVLVENYGLVVWAQKPHETKKWLEGLEYLMNYHVKLLMIKGARSSVI
ncbi:class II aldolase/adducin family protein [Ectobacillus sp. JY-23]|uniref:class II aldolase/adducin family protein n=1 Tax=Ectobacillus sp. JY-23 TaxID=2933872 RepID=UPI001FF49D20|nr:class II aldolase/adducin family protein [Ectobacillus sp. JY-23]UOY92640.1 class II aldolase/adducin family protein [Ectobacillus sp. JY-23]